MSSQLPAALQRLVGELSKLPGVGEKTATRFAFHVLKEGGEYARDLAASVLEASEKIRYCDVCFHMAEGPLCAVCRDTSRDDAMVCVVEEVPDLLAIERSAEFRGRYHVLHGVLAPLRGIGPSELRLAELFERLRQADSAIREIIVATNVGVEGEATALYIKQLAEPLGVHVSRIASGIPMGGDLEYIDQVTIARALEGRRRL